MIKPLFTLLLLIALFGSLQAQSNMVFVVFPSLISPTNKMTLLDQQSGPVQNRLDCSYEAWETFGGAVEHAFIIKDIYGNTKTLKYENNGQALKLQVDTGPISTIELQCVQMLKHCKFSGSCTFSRYFPPAPTPSPSPAPAPSPPPYVPPPYVPPPPAYDQPSRASVNNSGYFVVGLVATLISLIHLYIM